MGRMNNERYFDSAVEQWLDAIKIARQSDEELMRVMKSFAMEIERDTRHKAAEMAYSLSASIHNMQHYVQPQHKSESDER